MTTNSNRITKGEAKLDMYKKIDAVDGKYLWKKEESKNTKKQKEMIPC